MQISKDLSVLRLSDASTHNVNEGACSVKLIFLAQKFEFKSSTNMVNTYKINNTMYMQNKHDKFL